jgi:hypothetical protein
MSSSLLAEFGNKQLRSLKSASAAESDSKLQCLLIGELISREQAALGASRTPLTGRLCACSRE